jgi:hypothetical protein
MLRLGIEQKALSREEKYSSYSLGLGYKYSDIGLDYAYFYDGQLPYNSRHFISLAIDFPGMKGKLINLSNRDKMVAASEAVAIKGEINHPATKVSVGGKEYKLYNRMFEASVPVNVGKNKIEVIAMNEDNNILGTAAVKVLKMKTFVDVKQNYWAREAIENIGTLGIVAGFSAGKASEFKPDWGVNRAEMVTFLCSAAGVKPRRQQTKQFWDVPVNYWAAPFIKYGSDKGWVKGYEDKTFKPVNKVTKEQAVAIMVRFMGIEPDKNFEKPYDDVDPKSWASPYIAAAKKLGLLSYIKGKDFGPEKNMSRAEVCEIISKMPSVSNRIDDLLNFNIGY